MLKIHVLYNNAEGLYSLHDYIVQSSAANSLRFIIAFFCFMEPSYNSGGWK